MARAEAQLRIEVVYGDAPRAVWRWQGPLPAGTTLAQALEASGLLAAHAIDLTTCTLGIWGRRQPPAQPLRDGDRVEVYRPLKVDPKEARRLRYKQHLAAQEARRARRG